MKPDDKRLHCSDEKRNIIKEAIAATRKRRGGQIVRCFELKLNLSKLNQKQLEELKMLFVEGKWFYNHVLAYKKENEVPFSTINTTEIKEVKHFGKDKEEIVSELKFLKSQQKQQIVSRMNVNEKTIATLVRKGLQKQGGLKFKSELNSIPLPQYKISYVFKGESSVRIQGIHGKIRLHGIHQLRGVDEFASANLIHKPDGYYLKVTCYFNKNIKPVQSNGKELGIDFGISNNLTTSEGEVVNISVGESEHLKVLQKKLARQVKGSNNRKKTIHNIQMSYQKLNNRKRECANQFVHKMKQYKVVVIQDEQLKAWHENKRKGYSKSVQHSCMGMIKAKLKNLPNVIVLDEYIPTTKWCPVCGRTHDELTLNDREFICKCGRNIDRDIHAAQNMLHIAHLVLGTKNLVPTEHREVKRVEFLSKTKTMKHEADTLKECR